MADARWTQSMRQAISEHVVTALEVAPGSSRPHRRRLRVDLIGAGFVDTGLSASLLGDRTTVAGPRDGYASR